LPSIVQQKFSVSMKVSHLNAKFILGVLSIKSYFLVNKNPEDINT